MSAARPAETTGRFLRYGAAGFVLGLPTIPLFVLLPPLYAETLGLGLTATGFTLGLVRLLDVLTDPVIGHVSDRWTTRFGRWKPYIAAGAILGAIGVVFLLNPEDGAGIVYLGVWSFVLYLGWTLVNIPYLAWGAALSGDYQGRARVTSFREGFTLLGILAAAAVPAVAASYGYDNRWALGAIGWGAVGVGIVLFSFLLLTVSEPANAGRRRRRNLSRFLPRLAGLKGNKPFCLLIFSWLLNSLANGIPAVLFILFMKHSLQASEMEQGALTFLYFLAGVGGIPLWLWISRHVGKHRSWCFAMMLAFVSFAFVPLLGAGDIVIFAAICVATGIALGADLALPPAIQADVAEYEALRSGEDSGGTLFSIWSMVVKLSFALSVAIAFPLLDWLGFDPALPRDANNIVALSLIYALVPVALKICAILLVWRYPLTAEKQKVIQRAIARQERLDS